MNTSELRAKDIAALEKEITDLLKAHFGLRMQKAGDARVKAQVEKAYDAVHEACKTCHKQFKER